MASPLSILPSALPPTLPSALTPSLRPPLPPLSSTSSSTPPSSVPHLLSQLLGQLLSSALALHHAGDHPSLLLSVIRGFRQGVVYGAKIRFPHALVMTFLFRTGSLTDKASDIVQATYTHASTLGCYVALYKLLTGALRHLTGHTPSSNALVPLTSGFIAGAALFGRSTPITTQINMSPNTRTTATHAAHPATTPHTPHPSHPSLPPSSLFPFSFQVCYEPGHLRCAEVDGGEGLDG